MAGSAETSKQVEIAERRVKVAQLIKARMEYRGIAKALDVSLGTVASDKKALMEEWREEGLLNTHDHVLIDLATLADMQQGLTNEARTGELGAIDRTLKIMERRSKLLGLDAPEKREEVIPDGLTQAQRLKRMNDQELSQTLKEYEVEEKADREAEAEDSDMDPADDAGEREARLPESLDEVQGQAKHEGGAHER